MFTASTVLFLYAETSIHLGSGESLGAIDLAIQRERYTHFPIGAAAGIKGVARDWFERTYDMPKKPKPEELTPDQKRVLAAFGPDTSNADKHAGAVAFTDARVLLFPVRSMKGVFAWVTCPTVLERCKRDLAVAGKPASWMVPQPKENIVLGAVDDAHHACTAHGNVLLEEYAFTYEKHDDVALIARWLNTSALPQLGEYEFWRRRLHTNLLILPDDAFTDFVRHATEVEAHVTLQNDTKTVKKGGLFYQENLPCDTLLYTLILAQTDLSQHLDRNGDGKADNLLTFIKKLDEQRLQIGGDESTGKGLVCLNIIKNGQNAENGEGS